MKETSERIAVSTHAIPSALAINVYQTSLCYINNNNYIYEKVGAVKVSVSGSNDKRDIYVVGLSTAGDTLPLNHI